MSTLPAAVAAESARTRQSLISIVIPAFNRVATIAAALRSVQAQSYRNWEAVVVDDGSRDGTAETVERCSREDPRIRLVRHARNRGAQAARNTGIRQARGPWIAFLDSDDEWMADSLTVRFDAAAARGLAVVHSNGYKRLRDGRLAFYGLPALDGWIYRELLSRPGPVFQGLLVAKETLGTIGALDESIVALQEWDTAIRLAEHYRFGFVHTPTFIWDRRCEDTITTDRIRDVRGYEQVIRKHTEAIVRHAGAEVLSRHYATIAARYLAGGEAPEALRCLRFLRRLQHASPVGMRR
jgi:glycosyltransferase involved in cell wall biosynthesis